MIALRRPRVLTSWQSVQSWGGSPRAAASVVATKNHAASPALNFEDYRTVFKHKTTWELLRALVILKVCSVNVFVDNSLELMRRGRSLLGGRLFSGLVRPTFYRQFVGGDTAAELTHTADRLTESGLRLMVCPVQEEDVGEAGGDLQEAEKKYEANIEYIVDAGKIMAGTSSPTPNLQFKVTAFMSGDVVTKLATLIIEKKYTTEKIALAVAKAMGGNGDLAELREGLTESERLQIINGAKRLKALGYTAQERGLRLLCDAEYTYMNPGISALVIAMALVFNESSAVVSNTYQCYLKATLDTVKEEKNLIEDRFSRCFGAKVVRGAYMEKERRLAKQSGRPDPVNDTYEDTGRMYNAVIDFLLHSPADRLPYLVVATHNEKGVAHAAETIRRHGVDAQSGSVVFGQIYGMGEQISLPLASAGYVVYKSVPYGPLEDVLPYLSRRAAENRVVLSGARKELQLLKAELRRRILRRNLSND